MEARAIYKNFEELQKRSSAIAKKTIAVAAAHDFHTLEALFSVTSDFPNIDYLLFGKSAKILEIAEKLSIKVDPLKITNTETDEEAAKLAVAAIREKKADVLMKGLLQTGTLLKAVLDKETGIRMGKVMSHMAVLESPAYNKLLFISDGGMIPHPDFEQKRSILENSVSFMNSLGYAEPKIACLCAVESPSEKMPETLDAASLAKLNSDGEIKNCIVEGPLSFDLAISRESADIKGITSRVSGEVDMLLVPCITAGNAMTKALLYLGGAKMAGCVLGAKVPIVLVSRGASAEEKRLSILLAAVQKNN